jgi:plasmid rolling circle replication initiator protein Rep
MESIYDNLPRVKPSGEILKDGSNNWKDSKLKSIAVSKAFSIDSKYWISRTERMFDCGSTLQYAISASGEKRLYRANFCRDRMCPACQKRRSLVVFHQVKNVCTSISKDHPTYKYLLLTLTVPNVPFEELSQKISDMAKAWKRLTLRKEFSSSTKGWFRTLEVTSNFERGDYHPHYHILVCVPSGYFKKNYIKQERWLELWQEAMRDDSITQVDIRAVKPNPKKKGSDAITSAAAEVGKYATKPSNYIARLPTKDKYYAVPKVVRDLANSIRGKKLIAFGGLMLKHSKLLALKDIESDSVDLVNTGDDDTDSISAVAVQIFRWNVGFNNYVS